MCVCMCVCVGGGGGGGKVLFTSLNWKASEFRSVGDKGHWYERGLL